MSTRTLALRFDADADSADHPVVTALVDGREFLAGTPQASFRGFDPGEILGGESPLLPTDPPRRVAVYRCSCGEAGCGCIAPVISRDGEHVVWSDARDYTGVYLGPTVHHMPEGGTRLTLPELRFDARQYEAEVQRASADTSWETPRRAATRLLTEHLSGQSRQLEALGYRFEWASPHWRVADGFEVSLIDGEDRQVVVDLRAPEQPAAARAAELAEQLLGSNPDNWQVTFRGRPMPWPDEDST